MRWVLKSIERLQSHKILNLTEKWTCFGPLHSVDCLRKVDFCVLATFHFVAR